MQIMKPKDTRNFGYHVIGAIIVFMNYFRHLIEGYQTPRTFDVSQTEKAVDYNLKISDRWNDYLSRYLACDEPFKDKIVLELGPGPDLGAGLIALARGAKKYIALDVHNLAASSHRELYNRLFERLKDRFDEHAVNDARRELDLFLNGNSCRLEYIVDRDFRISRVQDKVDLVISQVAFEHFEDIDKTVAEIGQVVAPAAGTLYAHVDMKTHSRWIKDRDPLNIYRYSEIFWNIFKFRGSPNRLRVPRYKRAMEANQWENIFIEPRTVLEDQYVDRVIHSLEKKFHEYGTAEMKVLSFILMAQKK